MSKAHGSWFSVKWKIAVLSTVTVPSQHYLGSAVVDQKTNEIPVARELFKRGLHQRLDVSHDDDCCRVRNDNAMLVLGMMLRLSDSLFMQWREHQRRPDHVTTSPSNAPGGQKIIPPAHQKRIYRILESPQCPLAVITVDRVHLLHLNRHELPGQPYTHNDPSSAPWSPAYRGGLSHLL
jgi:hypothetical protein